MSSDITVNISIDVPDLEAGLAFYQGVFGFIEASRPFATMAILNGGNTMICVHARPEGSQSSGGSTETRQYSRHWTPVHLDFHVESLSQVLESVVAAGGSVERVFKNEGPRPVAFCADPFGNGFCLIAQRQ